MTLAGGPRLRLGIRPTEAWVTNRHSRAVSIVLLFSSVLGPASAHNPLPGLEGFHAGLWHPLSTPDEALALTATGLPPGSYDFAKPVPGFVALALGLLAGRDQGVVDVALAAVLLALAGIAGVWVAVLPGARPAGDAGVQSDRVIAMAGSLVGVLLAVFYLAGASDLLRDKVRSARVALALRVVASVAALALLLPAFLRADTGR